MIAESNFIMMPHRYTSVTHKATLRGGAFKFASIVAAVVMLVQSEEISPHFAIVTLATYQWSGRMDSGSVSGQTLPVEEEMSNNNDGK